MRNSRWSRKRFTKLVAPVALLLLLILVGLPALAADASRSDAASSSELWSPAPAPSECQQIRARMIMLDCSKSMLEGNMFSRARRQIGYYIDQAPVGTYLILARFGTTADIVTDAFILDLGSRASLKRSLARLQARHETTNFDEGAKLIEWTKLKLAESYPGRSSRLSVTVLSDEESSPDADKSPFSLREFFRKHLQGGGVEILDIGLVPEGTGSRSVSEIQGYTMIQVPVDSVFRNLQSLGAVSPDPLKPGVTGSLAPAPEDGSDRASRAGGSRLPVAIACAFLLLVGGAVAVWLRRNKEPAGAVETDGDLPTLKEIVPDRPRALKVLESRLEGTGAATIRQQVAESPFLGLLTGVPVSVGTDAVACTWVIGSGEGMVESEGEVFRVTLTEDCLLQLSAVPGMLCEGRPVPRRGLLLQAERAFRISCGPRQWEIRPVREGTARSGKDELLAKVLSAPKTEETVSA